MKKQQNIPPVMAEEVETFFTRAMKKALPESRIQRYYNLEDEENLAHTGMDVLVEGRSYMAMLTYGTFKGLGVARISMTDLEGGKDIAFNVDPFTLRNDLGNEKKKAEFEENLRMNLMDEKHPPRNLKSIVGSYVRSLNRKNMRRSR